MSSPVFPRKPDFNQLLAVMRRQVPERPTLFEFYLNGPLYESLAGRPAPSVPVRADRADRLAATRALGRWYGDAFGAAGYDYANFSSAVAFPGFEFRHNAHTKARSHSLNDAPIVTSWQELEAHAWPTKELLDPGVLDALTSDLPSGMGALVYMPNGVLENIVDLMGYDNLCYALVDDPPLVTAVAAKIVDALMLLCELAASHPGIGALIVNDDWGFKTQTMVSPEDLRRLVFPFCKRVTALSHAAGKPILLHSCGQLESVMDDVIDELHFDAKHSFEDVILPVEDVYERWGERIAILGGIDVNFLCSAGTDAITARSAAMLERAADRGAYALGSGNSIPDYVPTEAFFAMTRAALPSSRTKR